MTHKLWIRDIVKGYMIFFMDYEAKQQYQIIRVPREFVSPTEIDRPKSLYHHFFYEGGIYVLDISVPSDNAQIPIFIA